jgi:dipeptidyl aminopeptidase/acylaminoacyl peptidase
VGKYIYDQFLAQRRYSGNITFSPDGTEVAYVTDTTGQFNIWRQSVNGGWPFQVTAFEAETVRQVEWAPSGHIYFLADKDGDEFNQVYRIPARGGVPEPITDKPGVQFIALSLSQDGRHIYYAGNAIEPTQNHIFRHDMVSGEVHTLCGGPGFWGPGQESHDGRYLLVVVQMGNTVRHIYLCDLAATELKPLITGDVNAVPGPWAADDSGFYFTDNSRGEFFSLCFYDLATGAVSVVEAPEWDVLPTDGDDAGRLLFWVVNEGGYSRPYTRNLETGEMLPLPALLGSGVIETFAISHDGSRVAVRVSAANMARDIFVHHFAAGETARLTYSLVGGIDEADLVAPQLVEFPSFDRLIPGFLYKPNGVAPGQRVPVVVSVHGGPEAQEQPWYSGFYQYLLDQGVGLLTPNIRGSTGYGKSYQKLIHRDWGGGDLQDLKACAEFLRSLDWVDPERIAIFGGSYGGFATLQAVTRLPEYWACGVDWCGPSNLVTMAKSVPPTWRPMMKGMLGDPDEDYAMLVERSPITYVENLRCPLLVVQGAKDPRVVQAESDQMVERLRERGITVAYLLFEDEGHGFLKRKNQRTSSMATVEFLVRHLKG